MGENSLNFISEDMLLLEDIHDIDIPAKEEWLFLLLVEHGRLHLEIGDRNYTAHANDIVLCDPHIISGSSMISTDFRCKVIGISDKLRLEIFPNSASIWQQAFELSRKHIISIPQDIVEDLKADGEYLKRSITRDRDNEYYFNIVRCLIQSMVYRLSYALRQGTGQQDTTDSPMMSKDYLAQEFFQLLSNTHPIQRSVTWYAEKLNKTPKYLSTVVKKVSGRTAMDWIQEAATVEISNMLKNSPRSVKEICNDLDFPSTSFFSRYVHTHLGVSPTEYRRLGDKKKAAETMQAASTEQQEWPNSQKPA